MYCRLLAKFALLTCGTPFFNTFVQGKPLYSEPQNLASRNQKLRPIVCSKVHFDILNRLGVNYECGIQTDRQTDGQTDRTAVPIAQSNDPH